MSDTTPTTELNPEPARTPEPAPARGRLSKRAWIAIAAGAAVVVLGGTGIAYAATDGFDTDNDDDDLRTSQQQDSTTGTDDSRDRDDNATNDSDDSTNNNNTDPDDAPISDADRSKAEAAGLEAAGGTDGVVTDVDRSDDADHAWEVEVTFADNTDIDVELAADFSVVRVDKN